MQRQFHWCQYLVTLSSFDVNILSHYQVLMSISCHNFKSWCQYLVAISSLDVSNLSHYPVLISTSCHILKCWYQYLVTLNCLMSTSCHILKSHISIITIIVIAITANFAIFSHMLSPQEPTYARGREVVGAVMNRKYLVHSWTTQRDQESLKFWKGNILCTSAGLYFFNLSWRRSTNHAIAASYIIFNTFLHILSPQKPLVDMNRTILLNCHTSFAKRLWKEKLD